MTAPPQPANVAAQCARDYDQRSLEVVGGVLIFAGCAVILALVFGVPWTPGMAPLLVASALSGWGRARPPLGPSRGALRAGLVLLTLGFAGAGMMLGTLDPNFGLGLLFSGCCVQILFGLGLVQRVLLGLWQNVVSLGALLWIAPDALDQPHVVVMFSFYVGCTALGDGIGFVAFRMRLANARQRALLAERAGMLSQLSERTAALVNDQNLSLTRLAARLRAVRVSERLQVSQQLRDQLDPDLEALTSAFRIAPSRGLQTALATMDRVRAGFRRILDGLHARARAEADLDAELQSLRVGDMTPVQVPEAPQPENDETVAWAAYSHTLMGEHLPRMCWIIAAVVALWWPLDLWLYNDAQLLWGMAAFRSLAIVSCAFFAGTNRGRQLLRGAPLGVGVGALTVVLAISGWIIGQVGPLESGWGHFLAIPSVLMVGSIGRLSVRVGVGLLFITSAFAGYLLARPDAAHDPRLVGCLVTAALMLTVFTLLGVSLQRLIRTGFVQERRLESQAHATASLNVSLEDRVAMQTAQLRDMTRELQERRVSERQWIARELHDELGQELAALQYHLTYAQRRLGTEGDAAVVEGCEQMLAHTRATVSRIVDHLEPEDITALGLREALNTMVEQLPNWALSVTLDVEVDSSAVAGPLATTCYRIVQEAMTNVLKHADADQAYVSVRQDEHAIQVLVRDDGVGLAGDLDNDRGRGITGIHSRADEIGGTVEMRSSEDGGVELCVTLPLENERPQP